MRVAQIGLILFIFCPFDLAFSNWMEDVGNLVKEFSSMTDAGADVLEKIDAIGKGSYSMVRFAGPLAQLLHTGVSMALQQDSEQLKAIKSLQAKISTEFEAISRKIDFLIARSDYTDTMRTYGQLITLNIIYMEHLMLSAIDSQNQIYMEKFELNCKHGEHTPMRQLLWINKAANKNCRVSTATEGQTYAKAYALIGQIEEKSGQSNNDEMAKTKDYTIRKSEALIRLTALPAEVADQQIDDFAKTLPKMDFTNISSVAKLSPIFSKLLLKNFLNDKKSRQKRTDLFECFLKTIAFRYQRKRQPLLDHANIIITDVARIQMIGIMCAGVKSKGDGDYYQKELKSYDQITRDIANGLKQWITAELDSAWPHVILAHAEEALGKDDLVEADYENTAIKIRQCANERGNNNYLHQIVVSPAWEEGKYYLVGCDTETCAKIYQKRGVNVALTRYNENEDKLGFRLESLHRTIKHRREQLLADIRNRFKKNGGTSDLRVILSLSTSKHTFTDEIFGKYLWRNFVMVHNRRWFSKDCQVPVAIAGATILGQKAYDNETEYFNNNFMSVANRYKLILLM